MTATQIRSGSKIVVRLDNWRDPDLRARLAADPEIELVTLPPTADPREAREVLAHALFYIVTSTRGELPKAWMVDADFLALCPDLICVSTTGAGVDTVDVGACTRAGVLVVNQSGGNATAVAEHTLGLMLGLSRRITESDRRLRRERGYRREELMGGDLRGKTLGLVGLGEAGRRVAPLAAAFGMTVLAYDPYLDADEVQARGARPAGLEELLGASDFVSLHCPYSDETAGMFGREAFAAMKPGAFFISTARGGIHDELALAEALKAGRLGGAGIDVWEPEPPALDHPLLGLDNVIATYHVAGVTHEARRNMQVMASDQIIAVLRGERPPRLVNPEVWPAYLRRLDQLQEQPA